MACPWRVIAALAFVGLSRAIRDLFSEHSEHETQGGLPCDFQIEWNTQLAYQGAPADDIVEVISFRAICTEIVKNPIFKRPYLEKKNGRFVEVPFRKDFKIGENGMGTFEVEDFAQGASFVGKTFTFIGTKSDGTTGTLSITVPPKAEWEAAMKEKLDGNSLPDMPGTMSYQNVNLDPNGLGYKILLKLDEAVTNLEVFSPPNLHPIAKKTVPPGATKVLTLKKEDDFPENKVVLTGYLGLQQVVKVLQVVPKAEQKEDEVKKDEGKDKGQSPQKPSDKKPTEPELSDVKCVLIREKDFEAGGGVMAISLSIKCDADVAGTALKIKGSNQYFDQAGKTFRADLKEDLLAVQKTDMEGRELWFEGTAGGKLVRSNEVKIEAGEQQWVEPEKKKIEAGDAKCTISRGQDTDFVINIVCNTDVIDGKVMLSGTDQYYDFSGNVFPADTEVELLRLAKGGSMKTWKLWFEGKAKDAGTDIKSNEETVE